MVVTKITSTEQLSAVTEIALKTWPSAYEQVISTQQIDYMLQLMYSHEALVTQMGEKKHQFILVSDGDKNLGFASFELGIELTKTKIHKLYVLPDRQGEGIGKILIEYIINQAQKNSQELIFLNVNKKNPALQFYLKTGFSISHEEVLDIGNGFVMDDFVMEKRIN